MEKNDIEIEKDIEENTDTELEEIEAVEDNTIKKLRENLKKCETERRSQLEEIQRVKADFLNSKRRLEDQFTKDRERTVDAFIRDLLPLCDSFDMAMNNTAAWEAVEEAWRKGMEGVYSQLKTILKNNNVIEMGEVGEAFDPTKHEALGSEEGDVDVLVRIIQKGYQRDGYIIRPAKVIVGM